MCTLSEAYNSWKETKLAGYYAGDGVWHENLKSFGAVPDYPYKKISDLLKPNNGWIDTTSHLFSIGLGGGKSEMTLRQYEQCLNQFKTKEERPMIINFTILYDNGKTFEVNKPVQTNVERLLPTEVLYYTRKTKGLCVKSDYVIPMVDVAGLEIRYSNGDIKFRKMKPCAEFKCNMSKR